MVNISEQRRLTVGELCSWLTKKCTPITCTPMSTQVSREELRQALRDAPYITLMRIHSMSALWDCGTNTTYRFGIEAEKEDAEGETIARLYQGDRRTATT